MEEKTEREADDIRKNYRDAIGIANTVVTYRAIEKEAKRVNAFLRMGGKLFWVSPVNNQPYRIYEILSQEHSSCRKLGVKQFYYNLHEHGTPAAGIDSQWERIVMESGFMTEFYLLDPVEAVWDLLFSWYRTGTIQDVIEKVYPKREKEDVKPRHVYLNLQSKRALKDEK